MAHYKSAFLLCSFIICSFEIKLRCRAIDIVQKGENNVSEIEEEIVGSNNNEKGDINQKVNCPRNVDTQVTEHLDLIPGRRNVYDVLANIILWELNSNDAEVRRVVLTL